MRNVLIGVFAAALALGIASEASAQSTGGITADGSSTVYPITVEAARRAGVAIDVKFSGTGGGFRRFCAGETDISNASRPINKAEIAACAASGVTFVELPLAFDALAVVVSGRNDWARSITTEELQKLWQPAAEGAVKSWRDVRADWPDRPIKLFGRAKGSGTYDYFTSVIVGKTASSRGDYTASQDEEALAAGIAADRDALGFFGVGAYFRHWEELKDLGVDSGKGPVHPSLREVLAGRYQPLARPLFIYVKSASLDAKPALHGFLNNYLGTIQNWVHFTGYLPLSKDAYRKAADRLSQRTAGTRFSGELQVGVGIDHLYD